MTPDIGRFMFAVGAIIQYEESDEILLLQRTAAAGTYLPGQWGMVYGRKAPYETLDAALRREIEEETGLKEIEILKALRFGHFYHGAETPENEALSLTFWCRTGTRDIRLNHEHSACQWISAEKALPLVQNTGIREDLEMYLSAPETFRIGIADLNAKARIY